MLQAGRDIVESIDGGTVFKLVLKEGVDPETAHEVFNSVTGSAWHKSREVV